MKERGQLFGANSHLNELDEGEMDTSSTASQEIKKKHDSAKDSDYS